MLYSGKYKLHGQFFWRKLKRVKSDWVRDGIKGVVFEDESQIHFPANLVVIVWDRSRFEDIKNNVEITAGQTVPIKG